MNQHPLALLIEMADKAINQEDFDTVVDLYAEDAVLALNELLPSVAAEIATERPELILVQTVPATRALMQATKTIPIVMIGVGSVRTR